MQIPIIKKETNEYIAKIIKKNQIQDILEIGSGGGYSAIKMALLDKKIKIITIEKDKNHYQVAIANIKKMNLENQIEILNEDALETNLNKKFDLIFIDAAKSKNQEFFLKFKNNLKKDGIIITDNINFHGLLTAKITNKSLKSLVKKINNFKEFLKNNQEFTTEFIDIGDGLSVSRQRGENERTCSTTK